MLFPCCTKFHFWSFQFGIDWGVSMFVTGEERFGTSLQEGRQTSL